MAYIEIKTFLENVKHNAPYIYSLVAPIAMITPTADVVEVVRCKDCRKCDHSFPMKAIGEEAVEAWYCNTFRQWRNPDDFCSYGERKEK